MRTVANPAATRRTVKWKFEAPNGWRHERVTTHRSPPSKNWSWKPPKKPRVSRAELEAQRQHDLARLNEAWSKITAGEK
jgi:hypothetical protein